MSALAVSAADVVDIASDVWLALAGDAALPSAAPVAPMPADAVRAAVTIDGPWRGRVLLMCSRTTAAAMAAAVVGVPADQVGPEDVEDVLGELANVVGGAVKSLLPGSAALGLPDVAAAGPGEVDAAGVLRVDLVWRDQPVVVTLRPLDPAPDRPAPPLRTTARGETP